jgi:hypothetical protein
MGQNFASHPYCRLCCVETKMVVDAIVFGQ